MRGGCTMAMSQERPQRVPSEVSPQSQPRARRWCSRPGSCSTRCALKGSGGRLAVTHPCSCSLHDRARGRGGREQPCSCCGEICDCSGKLLPQTSPPPPASALALPPSHARSVPALFQRSLVPVASSGRIQHGAGLSHRGTL